MQIIKLCRYGSRASPNVHVKYQIWGKMWSLWVHTKWCKIKMCVQHTGRSVKMGRTALHTLQLWWAKKHNVNWTAQDHIGIHFCHAKHRNLKLCWPQVYGHRKITSQCFSNFTCPGLLSLCLRWPQTAAVVAHQPWRWFWDALLSTVAVSSGYMWYHNLPSAQTSPFWIV